MCHGFEDETRRLGRGGGRPPGGLGQERRSAIVSGVDAGIHKVASTVEKSRTGDLREDERYR